MRTRKITIKAAIEEFLDIYESKDAHKTAAAYKTGLTKFQNLLELHHVSIDTPVDKLEFDTLTVEFIALLQDKREGVSVATEKAYLTALRQFFIFLVGEGYADVPIIRINSLIKKRARKEGKRIPQVDIVGIEMLLIFLEHYTIPAGTSEDEVLRILRDRALIFVLAEVGLRIDEACKMIRGQVDWNAGRAIIRGKRDKEAVIRISTRTMNYLNAYLNARQRLDGATGKPLMSLPLFARHDLGAGQKILLMTTTTGRAIVADWISKCGLKDRPAKTTPHSLRHYYVTMVYYETRDLKLAQELARHDSSETTERYTHLFDRRLDEAYRNTFEKPRITPVDITAPLPTNNAG